MTGGHPARDGGDPPVGRKGVSVDLRHVECFLAVAEHLHFGKAAQALHLGQPTVSETVRRLEHELGGSLFERSTRRVALTPLGRAFEVDARAAYEGLRQAYGRAQALARAQAGEFTVGYAEDLGAMLVSRVVPALQARQPTTVLTFRAMSTLRQIELLAAGRLHAAICWTPELDARFDSTVLERGRFVAVVPRAHPFVEQPEIPLAVVAREPLVAWPRATNPQLYDHFSRAMDHTGVPWHLVGTTTGVDNVAARVLSGLGIGVVFEGMARLRPIDGVRYIPIGDGAPNCDRRLVWRHDEHHPALADFVRAVEDLFPNHRAGD
jgi:DNA-binding transcriptional LysR family regulator